MSFYESSRAGKAKRVWGEHFQGLSASSELSGDPMNRTGKMLDLLSKIGIGFAVFGAGYLMGESSATSRAQKLVDARLQDRSWPRGSTPKEKVERFIEHRSGTRRVAGRLSPDEQTVRFGRTA